jgi:hypothetical protein
MHLELYQEDVTPNSLGSLVVVKIPQCSPTVFPPPSTAQSAHESDQGMLSSSFLQHILFSDISHKQVVGEFVTQLTYCLL